MHQAAGNLLVSVKNGQAISPQAYDKFSNALERLQLEIFTLRREIEGLLYNRDPLTSTISRIDMLPLLREQQELIKRGVIQSCCLVMMDLDLFKNINDTYGHLNGDKVLVAAAHYIMQNLRPYDKIFRYGGEEFLICFQQTGLKQGHEMVERLREGLAKTAIDIGTEKPIYITASFGLTLLDPNSAVEQSIDQADKAVYAAKSAGRNRTHMWEAT